MEQARKDAQDPSFQAAQQLDPTLAELHGRMVVSEGTVLGERHTSRVPRLMRERGLLFREVGKRGKEWRQLVVPKGYQMGVLQLTHDHS